MKENVKVEKINCAKVRGVGRLSPFSFFQISPLRPLHQKNVRLKHSKICILKGRVFNMWNEVVFLLLEVNQRLKKLYFFFYFSLFLYLYIWFEGINTLFTVKYLLCSS